MATRNIPEHRVAVTLYTSLHRHHLGWHPSDHRHCWISTRRQPRVSDIASTHADSTVHAFFTIAVIPPSYPFCHGRRTFVRSKLNPDPSRRWHVYFDGSFTLKWPPHQSLWRQIFTCHLSYVYAEIPGLVNITDNPQNIRTKELSLCVYFTTVYALLACYCFSYVTVIRHFSKRNISTNRRILY